MNIVLQEVIVLILPILAEVESKTIQLWNRQEYAVMQFHHSLNEHCGTKSVGCISIS